MPHLRCHGSSFRGLLKIDLPLDEPTNAAKRYATFSADNIKAAFAKWLKVEDLAEVILGPVPK